MSEGLNLLSLEPTMLFVRDGSGLRQLVRVEVEVDDEPLEVDLEVSAGGSRERIALGRLEKGRNRRTVHIPDQREPLTVRFGLWAGGRLRDHREISWQPERHWEVHLVHGSHHDIGYTDLPSNVIRDHVGFLDQVLEFCDRTDDWPADSRFHWVAEQAWSVLAWLERRSPAERERLLRRLREGRVEATALLDNSTSELPSPEEQVRLVYPAFALKRRFGVPISSAELNDIPGVSWGLAKVLSGSGVRYFAPGIQDYFAWGIKVRPIWDEQAVISRDTFGAFWWEAQDGSRILFWYGGAKIESLDLWTCEQAEEAIPSLLSDLSRRGYAHELVRFKVHGGMRDNAPPDLRFSRIAREWNERYAWPRLVFSTNARFFGLFEQAAGSRLPVLRGDLPNTDYPIGATCRAKELGINRLSHERLCSAEKLSTIAAARGGFDYPAAALAEAWECMLLYDGHTGGMLHPLGPVQDASWCQKAEYAHRAAAISHDLLVKAANRIADGIRLEGDGYRVVVFNALERERTDVARVEASPASAPINVMRWRGPEAGRRWRVFGAGQVHGRSSVRLPADLLETPFELVEEASGERVPYQVVRLHDPLAARPYADQRWSLGQTEEHSIDLLNFGRSHLLELVFTAENVPSFGFRTYRIQPVAQRISIPNPFTIGPHGIENRFYRLELDPVTGAVASLFDKELGRELVDRQAPHGFHQVLLRSPKTGEVEPARRSKIEPGESGPLVASLVVKGDAPGCPQRTQEVTLYADVKRVDFATRLLRDPSPLREIFLAFPFDLHEPRFRCEIANGVVEPIRDQLPGTTTDASTVHRWVAAWDGKGSVTWASREAPVVMLGGLWPSPVSQAHHAIAPRDFGHDVLRDPSQLERGHLYSFLMNNNYRTNFQVSQAADLLFRYSVTSGPGDWRDRRVHDFGLAAATPLEPVCISGPQEGLLAPMDGFLSLDRPNVYVMALKAAEDGDGVVVRLAETDGRDTEVKVTLPHLAIAQASVTTLVEEDRGALSCDAHSFRVLVPAYGIATVRCRIGTRFATAGFLTRM